MSNQTETSGALQTSELSQGGTWKEKISGTISAHHQAFCPNTRNISNSHLHAYFGAWTTFKKWGTP